MIDIAEIERLIQLMEGADVAELSVEHDGAKIVLRRGAPAAAFVEAVETPPLAPPALLDVEPAEQAPAPAKTTSVPVLSPVVGVFHNGGMSDRRTLLKEGDRVTEGQVLATIDAMKVPNELRSPVSGIVGKLLVEDGAGVEFGQTLFMIEPEDAAPGG